jgi:hypothetical protein
LGTGGYLECVWCKFLEVLLQKKIMILKKFLVQKFECSAPAAQSVTAHNHNHNINTDRWTDSHFYKIQKSMMTCLLDSASQYYCHCEK